MANVQHEPAVGQLRNKVAEMDAELAKGQQAQAKLEREARDDDRTLISQVIIHFFENKYVYIIYVYNGYKLFFESNIF